MKSTGLVRKVRMDSREIEAHKRMESWKKFRLCATVVTVVGPLMLLLGVCGCMSDKTPEGARPEAPQETSSQKKAERSPGVVMGAAIALDPIGRAGGDEFERLCPPEHVVVGIRGSHGSTINSVNVLCAPLRAEAQGGQEAEEVATHTIEKRRDGIWITLNFRSVPLLEVVTVILEAKGMGLMASSIPKARVTLVLPEPVPIQRAYELLLGLLEKEGLVSEVVDNTLVIERRRKTRDVDGAERIQRDLEGIRKTGQYTYELTPSFLEKNRDEFSKLGETTNFVPDYRQGELQGVKVVGNQARSLLPLLGIHTGDILVKMNGVLIDKPEMFLTLFALLTETGKVELSISRRRHDKTLTYTLKTN